MNKALKFELDDLKTNLDNITTSDLQSVVYVLAKRFGEDEDDLLNYIYGGGGNE